MDNFKVLNILPRFIVYYISFIETIEVNTQNFTDAHLTTEGVFGVLVVDGKLDNRRLRDLFSFSKFIDASLRYILKNILVVLIFDSDIGVFLVGLTIYYFYPEIFSAAMM